MFCIQPVKPPQPGMRSQETSAWTRFRGTAEPPSWSGAATFRNREVPRTEAAAWHSGTPTQLSTSTVRDWTGRGGMSETVRGGTPTQLSTSTVRDWTGNSVRDCTGQ